MELIINSPKYGEKIVIIDPEDFELISKYNWHPHKSKCTFYAATGIYDNSIKNSRNLFMHNLIMGRKGIDHINHNGLDNRRINLRAVTQKQNTHNMSVKSTSKYGLKGVSYDKAKNAYSAHITYNYKHIFLGYFSSLVDAAYAYDEAALKYFKEFACLNNITKQQEKELRKLDISSYKRRGKNKTKYKGVSFSKGYYMARKTVKGKTYFLGLFKTDKEAAKAYENYII